MVILLTSTCIEDFAQGGAEAPIQFDSQIKPILSDRCYACHGPDEANREADLRLDQFDGLTEDRGGYAILVPGKPEESELLRRVTSHDEYERMPPAEAKLPPLSADEVEKLRQWITEGAEWAKHWSFVPPAEIVPPDTGDEWPHGPIDEFVLARLKANLLPPSPRASKETLIRRVTFDLTGLPPTLSEIDAFVQDTSPDAYEKLVDRLLASPHFGEHIASSWLDLARYSDTYGYQIDQDRRVWPWRDWVIRAINDDMPYDQFITWQLAGDLLSEATTDQVLATTFNRLHAQKAEGGSTPEEFRVEYVSDRVHTFGTAMLGLTLECCRCHDHKFDPISQREYYQLSAFFDNIDEFGLYSYFTTSTPTPALPLPTSEQQKQLAELERNASVEEKKLATIAEQQTAAFDLWRKQGSSQIDRESTDGTILAQLDFDQLKEGKVASKPGEEPFSVSIGSNKIVADGVLGSALQLTGDDEVQTAVGNFSRSQPFSVSIFLKTPDEKDRAVIFHRSRAWTDAGSRGYELLIDQGKLRFSLIHFWPGNAISIETREPLPVDAWKHVTVTYDGSSRADGMKIYIDGVQQPSEVVRDELTKKITGGGQDFVSIGARFRDRGFKNGVVDQFRIVSRELSAIEVESLFLGKPVDFATQSRDALFRHYLVTANPDYQAQLQVLQDARETRNKLLDKIPEIMVMRELDQPRQTYHLERGSYSARGELVEPETPAALGQLDADLPRNRLGLAHWLTDPKNPIAARVAVNRFWQICFGYGLVRTPEDFGSQGELPTHPALIDWLANDFVEHGWQVKRLMRQIVTSATYRQSSTASPQLLEQDRENRLLARGPRHRLSAEMIRDNALLVSGLLVDQFGGPPALPYQVTMSFKPRPHAEGAGLYRRSIYTHWQQTAPAPVMMTLDAAKREVCAARRQQTSTPLQALVLLNDPQMVEAARVLSERLILQNGEDTLALIQSLFRRLTSRFASDEELELLVAMYDEQLQHFGSQTKDAEKLVKVGATPPKKQLRAPRLAATTVVALAVMNFDDCLTKH